jgi:tetratricopeptide (TPR) repeat protein
LSYLSKSVDYSSDSLAEQFEKVEAAYWHAGYDSRELCIDLMAYCKKHHHPLLGFSSILYGRILLAFGENEKALSVLVRGNKLVTEAKDLEHSPFAMLWLGVAFERNKKYILAVEMWVKTIELALELTQLEYGVEAYLNVSMVYYQVEQYITADLLMKNGLKLAESINNKKLIAKSGIFLMGSLLNLGKYDAAIVLLSRIEPHALAHGDMTWLVQICNGYAQCYWRLNQPDLAIVFYESALAIARNYNLSWGYCIAVVAYGEFLKNNNRISEAFSLLQRAHGILKSTNIGDLEGDLNHLLYLAHKERGDSRSALLILRIYEHQAIQHLACELGIKGYKLNLNRLEKARGMLIRTHLKFEKLAGWVMPGVSLQHLRQFRLRCECAEVTDRVIELTMSLQVEPVIEQRIAALLNDYCTLNDLWVFIPPNRYVIYPGEAQSILMDFAARLASAIERLPWARYGTDKVTAKVKLQLASEAMLKQVDVLLKKELDSV